MDLKTIILTATLAGISTSANAVVVNTLNGADYQWLELTETTGLSRDDVELRLADSNDALFGYQYASRTLIEDLFLSYTTWDGLEGDHVAPNVVSGAEAFISDFGRTTFFDGVSPVIFGSVDGGNFSWYDRDSAFGMYGASGECGLNSTCIGFINVYRLDNAGEALATFQSDHTGWDALSSAANVDQTLSLSPGQSSRGSFLVKDFSPVPVPAAAWLFGSGLIGLIGVARRKKS